MHEMSIAMNVVRVLQEQLAEHPDDALKQVDLKVGEMSGIVPDSLTFCLETAFRMEEWEDVRIDIQMVPIEATCRQCAEEFRPSRTDFRCAACQSTDVEITNGQTLEIERIILE